MAILETVMSAIKGAEFDSIEWELSIASEGCFWLNPQTGSATLHAGCHLGSRPRQATATTVLFELMF
jgi:hypothetical protein